MQTQKKNGKKNGHSEISVGELDALMKDTRGRVNKDLDKPLAISIPALRLGVMSLTLEGDTPLIVHAYSQKDMQSMLDKQMGAAKQKKAPKKPQDDFLGALYCLDGIKPKIKEQGGEVYAIGKFGFPADGFRKSAINACRYVDGMKMTATRGMFRILGEYVEILGKPPRMRRDMVRLAGTRPVADIRFRPEFREWSAKLMIQYNTAAITPAQIANLYNNAGFGVGIGDWRPERGGQFGMFHVAEKEEVQIKTRA